MATLATIGNVASAMGPSVEKSGKVCCGSLDNFLLISYPLGSWTSIVLYGFILFSGGAVRCLEMSWWQQEAYEGSHFDCVRCLASCCPFW